jgi:hypothetical protein
MKKTATYALLLQSGRGAFFRWNEHGWAVEPIQGEYWSSLDAPEAASRLLSQLNDRINDGTLANVTLDVVYERAAMEQLPALTRQLVGLQCGRWQILLLEPLQQRVIALSGAPSSPESPVDWICQSLLPVLQASTRYGDEALQQARRSAEQAHADTMESLQVERSRLVAELEQLRAEVSTLHLPDIEHLVSYLPAIYRNVWGAIGPHDLALLAGGLQAPAIPSPFPEPSGDTLAALQRRLRRLPQPERQRLHAFCRQLPHKLTIRAEMREWLEGDEA